MFFRDWLVQNYWPENSKSYSTLYKIFRFGYFLVLPILLRLSLLILAFMYEDVYLLIISMLFGLGLFTRTIAIFILAFAAFGNFVFSGVGILYFLCSIFRFSWSWKILYFQSRRKDRLGANKSTETLLNFHFIINICKSSYISSSTRLFSQYLVT